MVIAVVIFWVVVGLGVFFLAMRGGPRGARQALYGESKTTNRLVALGCLAMFAFGIVVPTLVLANNGSSQAASAPGGLTLTAQQQHGRYLFGQVCATCHTLGASRAVGKVGPNLDVLRPPTALVLDALAHGRARGAGNMPAMLFTGKDAQSVAAYVDAVAGH